MKAVRLHHYHEQPTIEQVPEPQMTGPLDVIVRIGGAGLCRTDLHIVEGQWAEKSGVTLPYTLGHVNAGRVHEVGSAVSNVAPGRRHAPRAGGSRRARSASSATRLGTTTTWPSR